VGAESPVNAGPADLGEDCAMPSRRAGRWILAGAVVVVAAALAAGALPFGDWLRAFSAWIAGLGPWAYLLYALAYVLVAVLLLPAWLMTVGAGLLFGLLPGVAVVSVGSTAGAAASFLIARYVARDAVARYAERHARFSAIDRAIAMSGWRIVFLLRLSPVIPYVFSNYLYGLTAISFRPYVLASWAGMLPLTVLYASFGAAGREASSITSGALPAWKAASIAVGVLITVAVTLYVGRMARRALAAASLTAAPPEG
jgi:uncharacterized membrane protein YdjX (TVP38/TMEM64 family)